MSIRLLLGGTRIPAALAAGVRAVCLADAPLPAGRPGAASLLLGLRSLR